MDNQSNEGRECGSVRELRQEVNPFTMKDVDASVLPCGSVCVIDRDTDAAVTYIRDQGLLDKAQDDILTHQDDLIGAMRDGCCYVIDSAVAGDNDKFKDVTLLVFFSIEADLSMEVSDAVHIKTKCMVEREALIAFVMKQRSDISVSSFYERIGRSRNDWDHTTPPTVN